MKDALKAKWKLKKKFLKSNENTDAVGRIAAPIKYESTPSAFYFWSNAEPVLEENQIVYSESSAGGETIKYYGVIDEINERAAAPIWEEYDVADGDINFEPQIYKRRFYLECYAQVLRTNRNINAADWTKYRKFGGEQEAKLLTDLMKCHARCRSDC